jgi:uncharacterized damage-inducible protein DinB
MSELVEALVGESYAARPANILQAANEELAQRRVPGAPHTLYEELWHIVFWQGVTLDWISGRQTPFPERPELAFPAPEQVAAETWDVLRERFARMAEDAAGLASDRARLEETIRCPSRPGEPVRVMTVRDQLISLAAHNAYHFGRMVLLRQMLGAWPPPAGGFTW